MMRSSTQHKYDSGNDDKNGTCGNQVSGRGPFKRLSLKIRMRIQVLTIKPMNSPGGYSKAGLCLVTCGKRGKRGICVRGLLRIDDLTTAFSLSLSTRRGHFCKSVHIFVGANGKWDSCQQRMATTCRCIISSK